MYETRDSIRDIWGVRTPHRGEWPVRVDERVSEEPQRWVQSACVLCSNGCGVDIGVRDGRIVGVRGRAVDAVNHGRLGPKGLHGWEANASADRLTRPLLRTGPGPDAFREIDWDEAMDRWVGATREIRDRHTAGALGFYTSGQLTMEEYYTLAVIGKAGLGTPHMDGNTRLCTATAAAALKLSFGSDGQPASYSDLDTTDAILHVGHNIASQQTVLWARVLDRLAGPNPPAIIVLDPRRTYTARAATIHLPLRVGTNVAVLNGLLAQVILRGGVDRRWVDAHTVGYDALERTVARWTPRRVEEVSGVPARDLEAAGEVLASTPTLVSTVLQGVYQSNQATAAACQVNNVHLLRGLIGRDGCGVMQMNGQPTAQNTRETGADGDLPGFRNWDNPEHVQQLAELWNVDLHTIPHWAPPTHAMQIWRYAEQGSIKLLDISGTNPAVSLPDLPRVRRILDKPDLFVVVQDAWLTETAQHADLVLPTALWGEKTGTFTNVDRTVHLALQAVEPPGEARSDLAIWLDYARRLDLRDRDGAPLIGWSTPEEAFEAWKRCSAGRPCDYSALTYAKLQGGSGIQWPVTADHPDGTRHLYADGIFPTGAEVTETFGHDLETGAAVTAQEYRAADPAGKAILRAAEYRPMGELPDDEYPMLLTTGRLVHHFHTRTKTGRAPALQGALPDAFVQLAADDAARLGAADGDLVEVLSRRGRVVAPVRIGAIEAGTAFLPFHYGSWEPGGQELDPEAADRPRAANELTIVEWDPVSKQPEFKHAAVRISRVAGTVEPPPAADAADLDGDAESAGPGARPRGA